MSNRRRRVPRRRDRFLEAFQQELRGGSRAVREADVQLGDLENHAPGGPQDYNRVQPGIAYGAGPQTQRYGARGREGEEASTQIDVEMGGLAPFLDPRLLEQLAAWLQQTLRNVYQKATPPPWLQPPFPFKGIDTRTTGTITAAQSTILTAPQIPNRHRGVIWGFAHILDCWDDFQRCQLTIRNNNQPHPLYRGFTEQLAEYRAPKQGFANPIYQLRERDQVTVTALHTGGANVEYAARMVGWYWPTRVETGHKALSTIVD
jgi:hypothetical protein